MSTNPAREPPSLRANAPRDHEVIVIGTGVAGIYHPSTTPWIRPIRSKRSRFEWSNKT